METKKSRKGFTIVELVIVIAVIGILTAVLIPVFSGLINRANLAADNALVKNINTQLATSEVEHGKNQTMFDALQDAKEAGYLVENINAKSNGNELVWDQTLDRFALIDKDGNVIAGEVKDLNKKENLWKIYDAIPTTQTYSIYASNKVNASIVNVKVGFDAGDNARIQTINYTNTSAKEVTIRTNGGELIINAPNDTIRHFNKANSVNIIKAASASYHENGEVSFIQISQGRVELERSAKVKAIHVANVQTVDNNGNISKSTNTFSNNVILTLNNKQVDLSRDVIGTNINEPVLVCEVQANASSNEYIWLVGNGTIEDAKVYVTETIDAPNTSVASTVTTENASAAAKAIANNAVLNEDGTVKKDETGNTVVEDGGVDAEKAELANVIFEIKNIEDFKTFISANGTKYNQGILKNNLEVTELLTIQKNISLNLDGHKITNMAIDGRFLALADNVEVVIDGTKEGSGMEIPLSNERSYGFFKLSNTSSLTLNGGSYTGYTNNGAFIRPDNGANTANGKQGAKIVLNDINARTNYRFLASGNVTYADLKLNGGNFIQDNSGLTAPGGTIPAFWLCGYVNAEIDGAKIVSDIGSCMSVSAGNATLKNNDFYVKNENSIQPWNMTAISLESFAKVTIESGKYASKAGYGTYIFTSGGRLTINGGTFEGQSAAARSDFDSKNYNYYAKLQINGGVFKGDVKTNGDARAYIIIAGGDFTEATVGAQNVVYVDYSNVEFAEDGATATGKFVVTYGEQEFEFDLSTVEAESWDSADGTSGADYIFKLELGDKTYTFDFDVWSGYGAGWTVYISIA